MKQIQKLFKGLSVKSLKFDKSEDDPAITYSNYLNFPRRGSKQLSIGKRSTVNQSTLSKPKNESREELNPFNEQPKETKQQLISVRVRKKGDKLKMKK